MNVFLFVNAVIVETAVVPFDVFAGLKNHKFLVSCLCSDVQQCRCRHDCYRASWLEAAGALASCLILLSGSLLHSMFLWKAVPGDAAELVQPSPTARCDHLFRLQYNKRESSDYTISSIRPPEHSLIECQAAHTSHERQKEHGTHRFSSKHLNLQKKLLCVSLSLFMAMFLSCTVGSAHDSHHQRRGGKREWKRARDHQR